MRSPPFMTAYDHVGSSTTNMVGIANAFLKRSPARGHLHWHGPAVAAQPLHVESGKLLRPRRCDRALRQLHGRLGMHTPVRRRNA